MKRRNTSAALPRQKKETDLLVAAAFVGAISVLLMAAGYVIHRLAGEKAYREKWKDYNDCGWA